MNEQGPERRGAAPVRQQSGVAILVIVVLILLVATIGTLMIGRVGLFEQKAAGTDVRSREVYSAAIGGLEYGTNWFEDNFRNEYEEGNIAFAGSASGGCARGATVQPLDDPNANMETRFRNGENYNYEVTYELLSCNSQPQVDGQPMLVRVISTATAANDSHVNKTVSVDVMFGLVSLFSSGTGDVNAPPMVVEECMSGITGNPEIEPASGGEMTGVAVGTTMGSTDCLDEGHLDYNGGSETAHDPSQSAWDTIFGPSVTEEDLLALEEEEPSRIHYVDASYPHYPDSQADFNGNNWHADLGSPDDPVVMYVDADAGCPGVNGSPTIHGIVYYEEAPDCSYEGWGGATIHGSVIAEGDVTGFNANGEIHGTALDFVDSGIGGGNSGQPVSRYAEIPGSWKDH